MNKKFTKKFIIFRCSAVCSLWAVQLICIFPTCIYSHLQFSSIFNVVCFCYCHNFTLLSVLAKSFVSQLSKIHAGSVDFYCCIIHYQLQKWFFSFPTIVGYVTKLRFFDCFGNCNHRRVIAADGLPSCNRRMQRCNHMQLLSCKWMLSRGKNEIPSYASRMKGPIFVCILWEEKQLVYFIVHFWFGPS